MKTVLLSLFDFTKCPHCGAVYYLTVRALFPDITETPSFFVFPCYHRAYAKIVISSIKKLSPTTITDHQLQHFITQICESQSPERLDDPLKIAEIKSAHPKDAQFYAQLAVELVMLNNHRVKPRDIN